MLFEICVSAVALTFLYSVECLRLRDATLHKKYNNQYYVSYCRKACRHHSLAFLASALGFVVILRLSGSSDQYSGDMTSLLGFVCLSCVVTGMMALYLSFER